MTQTTPSRIEPLLARNRAFAATNTHVGLSMMPKVPVFVVTCLDPRVDPAAVLGLELGDAPVVRNVGGLVTDAVIDDIEFIAQLAGMARPDGPLFEVALVHHTNCGAAMRPGGEKDPVASVRLDVEALRSSPRVPARVAVSGHVYDVDTGLVTTIVDSIRTSA